MIAAFTALLFWVQTDVPVTYMVEESVEYRIGDETIDLSTRRIWISKNRIRVDDEEGKESLIYALDLQTLFVLNHQKRVFHYALTGRQRKLARLPLMGMAQMTNEMLISKTHLVSPTGATRKIAAFDCAEYTVNYANRFGVNTRIWSTKQFTILPRGEIRKIWYAALGASPPTDVRQLVSQLAKELDGLPVQVISTVEQDGFLVSMITTFTHMERHTKYDPSIFKLPKDYKLEQAD